MKIKNLLFATMICGAFGIFTACSNDEDPTITPDPDNGTETEEVDAILALSGGLDDANMGTRASMLRDGGELTTDPDVTSISSLAVAVFEVGEKNQLGKLILFEEKDVDSKTGVISSEQFDLPLLKFKVNKDVNKETAQVGLVVIANYNGFFLERESNRTKLKGVKTFSDFKTLMDKNLYTTWGLSYYPMDQSEEKEYPNRYPMSSNVFLFDVTPGQFNYVGYSTTEDAKAIVKKNNDVLGNDASKADDEKYYTSLSSQPIRLYRGAAEVELTNLTFADYSPAQKFSRFVLEDVYMANVPSVVNWFGETPKKYTDAYADWGQSLNPHGYIDETIDFPYSLGNEHFSPVNLSNFLAGIKDQGTGDYRTENVANKTTLMGFLDFQHNSSNLRNGTTTSEFVYINDYGKEDSYGQFKEAKEYPMRITTERSGHKAIKFAVSPSNYGSATNGQAMVLIVKGRYFYKTGTGAEVGPVKSEPSRYYTVIINENGELGANSGLTENTLYEVKRNVRYEIALKINGPGSESPWTKDPNTYVVPKVTIVPFGVVSQEAVVD